MRFLIAGTKIVSLKNLDATDLDCTLLVVANGFGIDLAGVVGIQELLASFFSRISMK